MLQSMTGYGKSYTDNNEFTVTVEIKALNSRQMDLSLRLPSFFREKELDLRNEITKELERGKVDFSLSIDYRMDKLSGLLNKELFIHYYNQFSDLKRELGDTNAAVMEIVAKMPDVFKQEKKEVDDKEWEIVHVQIIKAIDTLKQFRLREGAVLGSDFEKRIKLILIHLKEIEKYEKERMDTVKDRIRKQLEQYVGSEQIDKNRFEQELIYFMEKLDITEEKVRLKMHCDYFLTTMNEPGGGRKLNFISQEIGREINTIGSKANHAEIQKLVVLMKDELEKIKEQTMNVL